MIEQIPKQLIDVGEIGNASTGDILYDGGVKLNADLNQIYNTFGDQRLFVGTNQGEGLQKLHATGYYQKMPDLASWGPAIPLGAMVDVDARVGIMLARLERGKVGEGMVFINSNGSLSQDAYLEIQPNGQFIGLATPNLKITQPFSKVTVWCIDDSNGISTWDYSIENMFGDKSTPLNKTYNISNVPREIRLAHSTAFQTMKLLLTASSADGKRVKTSEVILYVDVTTKKVYSTEYGVMRLGNTNEEDGIYQADFIFDNSKYIALVASATQNVKLAVKVMETQTIGVGL